MSLPEDETIQSVSSSDFLRWRPRYHVQAPNGWMNDPCAPGYDPITGQYHLFFQCNPQRNENGSVAWANISWGHATSRDLINWTISAGSVLEPDAWYDQCGCFTGCLMPTGVDGQPSQLTIFYTGVSRLPLHYTLQYVPTTETLVLAQYSPKYKKLMKLDGNPILSRPPDGFDVTGWRDPFVARWPALDSVLDCPKNQETLYGMISGGIRGITPAVFLYQISKENPRDWKFLGCPIDVGLNHNISRWSGDMGINWECANFMTLVSDQDGSSREFLIVGGEGSDITQLHSTGNDKSQRATNIPRAERSLQWMCGRFRKATSHGNPTTPKMDYLFGSRFDHGCLYAVNTFHDPVSLKQLAWGWVTEEDLPQKLVDKQNWSGMISIPRELSLISFRNVTGTIKSSLWDITSIEVEEESPNTFTIRTLGISPAKALDRLRDGSREIIVHGPKFLNMSSECSMDIKTNRFELDVVFAVSNSCTRIGFSILHSTNGTYESATSVYFVPDTETLVIDRPQSDHIDPNILCFSEKAPFTLFSFARQDTCTRENLHIRAWFDESVIEVFANGRCTFASRIYPESNRCGGIKFWAEDEAGISTLVAAKAWDGLNAEMKAL